MKSYRIDVKDLDELTLQIFNLVKKSEKLKSNEALDKILYEYYNRIYLKKEEDIQKNNITNILKLINENIDKVFIKMEVLEEKLFLIDESLNK